MRFSLCLRRVCLLSGLLPLVASAYTLPKWQRAKLLQPQHIEVSAGLSGGSGQGSLLGIGRLGLSKDYEAKLGFGTVILEEEFGFETALGLNRRLSIPSLEKEGFFLSVAGDLAIAKAGLILAVGFDPMMVLERQFLLDDDKVFFLSLGLGLAATMVDQSGEANTTDVGIIAGLTGGLDFNEDWRGLLELSLRDDAKRLGIGAATHF